jgi:carotenoid cleavage dioxygenase-like enzyme
VDPTSLETLPGKAVVDSLVLNAHPACDGRQCFVQHPCPPKQGSLPGSPLTDQACFSLLHATTGDLQTELVSRATLPYKKLIQHSHSPCITPRFVVAKLDAFAARDPLNSNRGMLHELHQGEDSLWLVLERSTNQSTVLSSGSVRFVNNHFWNCYEDAGTGDVVVETVATTSDYLDTYFEHNLQADTQWAKRFQQPLRCRVPTGSNQTSVACAPLSASFNASLPFDYPTFNPHFKMRPDYRYFYAITPVTAQSKWFNKIVKVDVSEGGGTVVAAWSRPGSYVTEADFVPRTESKSAAQEDDGVLLSVLYNEPADQSSLGVFDAASLTLLDEYSLGGVVPFHAHGIVCPMNGRCFTNP